MLSCNFSRTSYFATNVKADTSELPLFTALEWQQKWLPGWCEARACGFAPLSWGSAGAGDASGSGGTGGFSGSSCGEAQAEFAACQEAMLWK